MRRAAAFGGGPGFGRPFRQRGGHGSSDGAAPRPRRIALETTSRAASQSRAGAVQGLEVRLTRIED